MVPSRVKAAAPATAKESAATRLTAMGIDQHLARLALEKERGHMDKKRKRKTEKAPEAAALATSPEAEKLMDWQSLAVPGPGNAHVSERQLQRLTSTDLHAQWAGKMRAALPEYKAALERICVADHMMATSRLSRQLEYLESQMKTWPSQGMETVTLAAIQKAWGVSGDRAARQFSANVPGVAEGNMFEGAMQLHQALRWERGYLTQALSILTKLEDATGLQIILALMRRGANECQARKSYVFSAIVGRVKIPGECAAENAGLEEGNSSDAIYAARRAVSSVVVDLVEETKDKAFKTIFLEPTKMYFRAVRDSVMEGDVEVHGANVYLTILLATLGVQLNRRPYMSDEVKGIADFLAAGMDESVAALWKEENFGHDWDSIRDLRGMGLTARRSVDRNVFIYHGYSARDVANAAVDAKSSEVKKEHLARYLEQFTSWFGKDFILPRMVSRLTSDEGRLEALQTLFDDLAQQDPQWEAVEGEEDVRFWLWNMEEFPAKFRADRAERLLLHARVLRASDTE